MNEALERKIRPRCGRTMRVKGVPGLTIRPVCLFQPVIPSVTFQVTPSPHVALTWPSRNAFSGVSVRLSDVRRLAATLLAAADAAEQRAEKENSRRQRREAPQSKLVM